MFTTIGELLAELDEHRERVSLECLKDRLNDLDVDPDEVREYMRFSDKRYQRNLLRSEPAYHALVLCWRNGQRSPIHDHQGSSCGVRILRGVATETVFEWSANGLIYPARTRELSPGMVTVSQDDDIHQMSNLQPGDADLVTLHVYSPPLLVMGTYSLTDPTRKEVVDPVFEFAAGAGI